MQTLVIPLKYQENVFDSQGLFSHECLKTNEKGLLYSCLAFYSRLKICKLFIQMPMFGISNQINVLLLCTNITTISFSSPWQRKLSVIEIQEVLIHSSILLSSNFNSLMHNNAAVY